MALLISDCPRCGAKEITFEVTAQVYKHSEYEWKHWYEVFSICRACVSPTIFLLGLIEYELRDAIQKPDALVKYPVALNRIFEIKRFISVRDRVTHKQPEHLPKEIENAFIEGAACLSIGCNNAAATMFRLCIDLVTQPLLPEPTDSAKPQPPNNKTRRNLGLRLPWLFESGLLPSDLKDLAKCIRENGNDGAHVGNLSKDDAEDVLDFTIMLLERLITEPRRLKLAEERRNARRGK